jgi:hypothetical protein
MEPMIRPEVLSNSVRPQTVKHKEFSYASLQVPVPVPKRVSKFDILAKAIKDFQQLQCKNSDFLVFFD